MIVYCTIQSHNHMSNCFSHTCNRYQTYLSVVKDNTYSNLGIYITENNAFVTPAPIVTYT